MNLLASRRGRAFLFSALYLSEGAPIGWLWWALPARLRESGADVERITALTASLTLVWAAKALWAPVVDGLRGRRWGYRGWAVAAQLAMGATLLPLLARPDLSAPDALLPVLLLHAICAATQDVAVDGLAVSTLPLDERGSANGWMQAGMLLGRGTFAALALSADDWTSVVAALVTVTSSTSLLLVFCAREPASDDAAGDASVRGDAPARPRFAARVEARLRLLADAFLTRRTLCGLLFALIGGAAFEASAGTANVLLVDLGVPSDTLGVFYGAIVLVCMAAGALLGGRLSDRVPRLRATRAAVLATAAAVTALALGVLADLPPTLLLVLLGAVYVVLGAFTSISYALFMDLTDPRVPATQVSAFMGVTNLCESWALGLTGTLVVELHDAHGEHAYAWAWLLMSAVSLLALLPLAGCRAPRRLAAD
ncbi:MAG: MFS transporter [Planctomycetes bacterium]|nr:MFS transporter [Planctomycetota bacterium]